MNKYLNTFATLAEYNAYMAGNVVSYPNFAYIEATDEVVKVLEEPVEFSIEVEVYGTTISDGDTYDGGTEGGEELLVYGYINGNAIEASEFSVACNNLSFSEARDGWAYDSYLPSNSGTYNYTITATCNDQTVTFSFTYDVQGIPQPVDYRIVLDNDEESDLIEDYNMVKLQCTYDNETWEDVMEGDEPSYFWNCSDGQISSDDIGGVDATWITNGDPSIEDGKDIYISVYDANSEMIAEVTFYYSVQSKELILTTDPSDPYGYISEGFCDDTSYYVVLCQGGMPLVYDGERVEYECDGQTYQPSLYDPEYCIWSISSFDPSISEVVCYDAFGGIIATLQTSCYL